MPPRHATPPHHRRSSRSPVLPPTQVAKAKAKHEKKWEKTRDERVGSWRDFVGGKAAKKQKTGGIKVGVGGVRQ